MHNTTDSKTKHNQSKAHTLSSALGWLWPYWKRLHYRLIFLIVVTPLAVLFDVWAPMFIKSIFDQMQQAEITQAFLKEKVLIILALGSFHFIFYIFVQSIRGITNFHFENVVRVSLSRVMIQLGQKFFYRFRTGDVTTRLIDDISERKLGWFACSGIFRLYEALLTILGCLFFMLQLNLILTLLTALPLSVIVIFYIQSSRKTLNYSRHSQEAISALNAYLTSTLDGIRVLKAYGQEKRASEAFSTVVEHQYSRDIALAKVSSLLQISYSRFSELGVLVVFLVGGWLVIQHTISLGTLIAFNSYIFMLIWPMVDIGQFFIKGRQASISVERVRELEDYPADIVQAKRPLSIPKGPLQFEFSSVSYAFDDKTALHEVHFSARSGEQVALAGSIGSGKSLLLDMVPRMLEPQSGTILLNGEDLKDYDLHDLRTNIGFVSQTPSLFSASIRENILFGRQGFSESELNQAIQVAQLEQDLVLFQQGLDTLIGQRGVKISGGQKQRIAIARALLTQPRVLILDDCTSALDAETEARFWQSLHDFAPGILVLLVTHRVRTLQQADQIVLLSKGQVSTQGTHQSLSHNQTYQQLYLSAYQLQSKTTEGL